MAKRAPIQTAQRAGRGGRSADDPPDSGWRTRNIGRLLNNAVIRFESRILQRMAELGQGQCSLSHINVTRNLDLEGTRATELARRASMTKQSMAELINQLETLGLIMRVPDPSDRRARLVRFTEAGLVWMDAFRGALADAEHDMQHVMGKDAFATLRTALSAYDRDCRNGGSTRTHHRSGDEV
ncbi:MAG: MarR family transcriptional regulator [Aquisalimonadaceae bacterium]